MKLLQLTSIAIIMLSAGGCTFTADESLKDDLFGIGLVSLFILIYSSHLIGLQNDKNNGR
jgi:hypothetical protein